MNTTEPNRIPAMLSNMLENQVKLNNKSYDTQWLVKGKSLEFDYNLAASQEIAEFINSYGYSWWSSSPKDLSNCRTEIVDAVHFMLSQAVIEFGSIEEALTTLVYAYVGVSNTPTLSESPLHYAKQLSAELLTSSDAINTVTSSWFSLFRLCETIGFSIEHLYARYMAKSALNAFRQEKGYRNGTFKQGQRPVSEITGKPLYLKMWEPLREDNYVLSSWIDDRFERGVVAPSKEETKAWLETSYEKFHEMAVSCVGTSAEANKAAL